MSRGCCLLPVSLNRLPFIGRIIAWLSIGEVTDEFKKVQTSGAASVMQK
jgi:hypothetical protein